MENEVTDSFGVSHGIGNTYGAALGDTKEREALDANCVYNRAEIFYPGIEGQLFDLPVRHAIAASVVADERMLLCKPLQQVAPYGSFPIVFEMVQPIPCFHERWSTPCRRIGNANTIFRAGVFNLLFQPPTAN